MSTAIQWYMILVLGGLLLVGAEIFVPGGILGLLGGLALLGAIVVGLFSFPPPYNILSALGILFLSAVFLFVWIKYFPRTRIGRSLTLSNSVKTFKATDDCSDLLGHTGTARSDLRPSGIALLENRRVDVIAQGRWIPAGAEIRVIKVEGNIITVREVEAAAHASD